MGKKFFKKFHMVFMSNEIENFGLATAVFSVKLLPKYRVLIFKVSFNLLESEKAFYLKVF